MNLTPLPEIDAVRIVKGELDRLNLAIHPAWGAAVDNIAASLRFDHDTKRFHIVDSAGNPLVDVDDVGVVRDVDLESHLRKTVASAPHAFNRTATAAGSADGCNPYLQGRFFNRTQQALLENKDPDAAARLKAEADRAEGRDNPWTRQGWNMTKQVLLRKSDPEKAKQLADAAGVDVDAMRPAR